ncbi:MAG TPA: lysoplasmalogenase [Bacteroidia bacterium]|nr:lysoplasmalogenase [Bacteroidia bacterium]
MNSKLIIFIVISAVHLVVFITKPLLMPILLWYFTEGLSFGKLTLIQKRMITALTLAWIGDIVNLYSQINHWIFMAGVIIFLAMQIMYIIICFYLIRFKQINQLYFIFSTLLFIAYGSALLWILLPHLNELTIPVLIYASALTLTGIASALTKDQLPRNVFYCLLTGTLLYMTTDSLDAINNFKASFPYAAFWIALTYLSAQMLITIAVKKIKTI